MKNKAFEESFIYTVIGSILIGISEGWLIGFGVGFIALALLPRSEGA